MANAEVESMLVITVKVSRANSEVYLYSDERNTEILYWDHVYVRGLSWYSCMADVAGTIAKEYPEIKDDVRSSRHSEKT